MSLIKPLMKTVTANVLIFLAILFIVTILAEGYYRFKDSLADDGVNDWPFNYWGKAYPESSPDIYKLIPGHYKRLIDGEIEEFQISDEGYRQPNFDLERPIDLVVYGDSFTFGHGVSEGKRFTDILTRKNENLNIANFSYNAGFTTPHYLLHYNNHDFDASRIWIFTYLGNDCQSDLGESEIVSHEIGGYPSLRVIKNGDLYGDSSAYPVLVRVLSDNSVFLKKVFNRVYSSRYGAYFFSDDSRPNTLNKVKFDMGRDSDACIENIVYIKNIERACKTRNKSCAVINYLIPQDFFVYLDDGQTNHTNLYKNERETAYKNAALFQRVIENCNKHSVECINLLPVLKSSRKRLYFNNDAHWNREGHSVIADFLGANL